MGAMVLGANPSEGAGMLMFATVTPKPAAQRMNQCLSESDIGLLAASRPSSRDAADVEGHLAQCSRCRRRLLEARIGQPTEPVATIGEQMLRETQPAAAAAGMIIEGYEVLERVHAGGQGVVFKAVQRSTNRTVAVKVLPHEDIATTRQKQRFEREVSLAASLRHPNIVTIYDSGLTSGRYFYAMEYVHGVTLDQYSATHADVRGKLLLFAKICGAVAHAHQRNIVHRDLKPANILVDARGEPHVLDFGLAKSAATVTMLEQPPLTLTSQFMGTLAYAAPEQTVGDPSLIDRRTDVYALGMLLFQMLTGAFPYPMPGDLIGTFEAIRSHPPRKPSEAAPAVGIDRDLDTIVLRALAKEPERRYQSAEEFASDVQRYLAGEPIAARRDSVGYVMNLRTKAVLRRHRVLTTAGVVTIVALAASVLTLVIGRWWAAPMRWFEFIVAVPASAGPAGGAMDDVRIVAFTNLSEALGSKLAAEAGIENVSGDDPQSLRRLHGWLMERLARAQPRAVVWDFAFRGDSPHDQAFVDGVQALRQANIGVCIALWNWTLNERGEPTEISQAILRSRALWGGITLGVDKKSIWKLDVVMQHPSKSPMLGLALAALSAWRHPNMDVQSRLARWSQQVELEYRDPDTPVMQVVQDYELVRLTAIRPPDEYQPEHADMGVQPDSLVGYYALRLPDEPTLRAAMIDYERVFRMSDDDLRRWAAGRLILFGDWRLDAQGQGDRHVAPDGRILWGSEAHAVGIASLLHDAVPARYPPLGGDILLRILGAAMGVFAAQRRWGPMPVRVIVAAGMAAALVAVCIAAYHVTGYLCQPLGPLVALVLGFAAWLAFDPLYSRRTEAQVPWRTAT